MAASTNLVVLILGENGMGRKPIAHHLHDKSRCSVKPFVAVNCCSSLPVQLELFALFGHVKGTFVGNEKPDKNLQRSLVYLFA